MQIGLKTKRIIGGAAMLVAIPAMTLATAQPSQAAGCGKDTGGENETVSYDHGAVKATFCAYDELLKVSDNKTDGKAAYAYVEVHKYSNNTGQYEFEESDAFKVTWKKTYQLGTPDGTGGIADGKRVWIQVCKGKMKKDASNCSSKQLGIA